MPRPKFNRHIGFLPKNFCFKPKGIPLSELEEVVLSVDELEAMRLADCEGLYQEQSAQKMQISRQTFGRVLESAHKKVAQALIEGKAIRIEGTEVKGSDEQADQESDDFVVCGRCNRLWHEKHGRRGHRGRHNSGCPNCDQ